MTIPQPTVPPAGWYTDPSGQPGERWWDGANWTQQTRALPPAQPAWNEQQALVPPTPTPEPAQAAGSSAFAMAMQSHSSYVPSSASVRPAGWYPDDTNYGQQRWWDGNQWTAQVSDPYQGGQGYDMRAPAGTSPYTSQIWWIVGIYVAMSLIGIGYVYVAFAVPTALSGSNTGIVPTLGLSLFGLLGWIAAILLAASDGRELRSRGVTRPFHWAFTCIPSWGPTIYIIGRSIVVRRRTGSGVAPMWVHIIVTVTGYVITYGALFAALGLLMNTPYGSYGY
jgi:hypothetical protein